MWRRGRDRIRHQEAGVPVRYRGHPQYGIREAASRVAAELAPLVGLQAGTGRTYIAEELRRIEAAVAGYLARGNLAVAAGEGDQ
jgi:hypothetical protein